MSISFAIIGCGNIAGRHAEIIQQFGRLVAVADIDQSRADKLGNQYGANIYYSIEELFQQEKNLDIVAICTPNGLHADHSIKSLQSGCHVLCEKPMAINTADCKKMIKTAGESGKKILIVKQNRFNPPVAAVKKLIEEGKLGRIYSFQLSCFWSRDENYYKNSWRGNRALDGGTLFTQFSHFIDLLYWMIGDIKNVKAFSKNAAHQGLVEFEDEGVAVLELEDGVLGTLNFTINSYKKNAEGSLVIIAEKGIVKIGGQYLNTIEYHNIEGVDLSNVPAGNPSNDYGFYQGSMSNHDLVYKNLVSVLNDNAEISASARDGLKTVEIIEKIYAATVFNL